MAVLADLLAKVRVELADQPKPFTKTFVGDGTTTQFTLGFKPVDKASITVTVNSTPVATPAGYVADENFGVITFVTAPAANSSIQVTGSFFRYFTDTDLTNYINTAITQHTAGRTDAFGSLMTIGRLQPVEDYPLAILASIEALWALATDAAFDIDINAPDGVMIPRSERFRQLGSIIQARTDQYKQLCSALNVGIWRIEMGVLRRVSRTTNKLVPVYMPQEIDDSRRPERVYMQNDLLGRTPIPTTAQIYDLVIYQGDSWSALFDFPFDMTGYTVKAQMRTYPGSPALYATFDVAYTDRALGKVTLSLPAGGTAYLPPRAFWDLQLTVDSDPTYEETYIKGQVFVDQQVTI